MSYPDAFVRWWNPTVRKWTG